MAKSWFQRKNNNNKKPLDKSNSCTIDDLPNYGFVGFRLYFYDFAEQQNETWKIHVESFMNYILQNQETYTFSEIVINGHYSVDYQVLTKNEEFLSQWSNFKNQLLDDSEYCLQCMGLAMHQFIYNSFKNKGKQLLENVENFDLKVIYPRIINYEPILNLKDMKVNYYGKLVTLKGTVIRAAHTKLVCQYLSFKCSQCEGSQLVKQIDGCYTVPSRCPTKGCRALSNFSPIIDSPFNRNVNWQIIKIQELIEAEEYENARIPRTLECELTEDLVNTYIPGDDITITGIIKVKNNTFNNIKNKQNTVFSLFLHAISIWNSKKQNSAGSSTSSGITFNTNDYYLIKKIHSEPHIFKLLVHSLCPNIYGHEIVKAGLLLALLGGTKSDVFRAESHVLIVGDPGLGKSQMLQACSNVAPRGVYVCGNTSTNSGLTITVVRDGSEYALEAGALMLADQGCCCIDEFDKMPTQHACLLETMEQQSISIAKAGVVCSLPTRATILAAANPAGGHYNKAKTIAENLKMSSPMLSRFDLIFILLDQTNEKLDLLLTKHILGLHRRGVKPKQRSQILEASDLEGSLTENESLRSRLNINGENIDCLPHNLFRKYIAYAQKYVHPQLSDEAKKVLQKFYLSLRKQFQIGDCTPVTTRQLNSLIRLTQARAKAELREVANEQDASDVIEIMKFSLVDVFSDDCGILDKTRSQNGTGTSSRAQSLKLLKILQRRSDIETKSLFTMTEITKLGEQIGIDKYKIYNIIEGLNLQGFLLNKGGGKYELITANL